jgi:hypothetical protein
MIALKTSMALATSSTLTVEQREYISDLIATRYLDQMDGRDLERFFFDEQMRYLNEYTDAELVGALEDVTSEDEYTEVLNEIG